MKRTPFYISLFIFAVIGILASIAAVFPEEGITVGSVTLDFPTLDQVFADESQPLEPQLSPEELLALRAEQMRLEEEEQILSFFRTNDARIQFPITANGDTVFGYLDAFYAELDSAKHKPVRVVHYGDSQIEEDRISNILRRHLQERFGGMGCGLLPLFQTVQSQTIAEQTSREPKRYFVFGNKELRREGSNRYGPMGQMSVLDSTFTVTVTARSKQTGLYSAHYFNRLRVLSASDSKIYVNTNKNQKRTIEPQRTPLQVTELQMPDSSRSVSITFSGSGDLYGIILDDTVGVNVDNIPLRGCSGTIFTNINSAQLSEYFRITNTQLILLQFGGNSMPYLKTEKQADKYIETLLSQVRYVQAQAPKAKILFIGPSDMTTRLQGKMQTYPILTYFDHKLSSAMTEQAGVAYWSLFEAMGGVGAMSQWVKSGLAASDYIHFSRKGANEVGEMLVNAIFAGYKYYEWKKEKNTPVVDVRTQPDTLKTEQPKLPIK